MDREQVKPILTFYEDAQERAAAILATESMSWKEYEQRLDAALDLMHQQQDELTTQINELKKAGKKHPLWDSQDPGDKIKAFRNVKSAYTHMASASPSLPPPGSPLPGLIAFDTTAKGIISAGSGIEHSQRILSDYRSRVGEQQRQLTISRALRDAMNVRLKRLRTTRDEEALKTAHDRALEAVEAKEQEKLALESETTHLNSALWSFTRKHLAVMLAAEEIGGPMAGEDPDVDELALEVGFTAQGKPRNMSGTIKPRKQRTSDIFGTGASGSDQYSEVDAAAAEMRFLLQQLLQPCLEGGKPEWITLARDSAAARFLVRAKVAELDPEDARQIRLSDFGSSYDDL